MSRFSRMTLCAGGVVLLPVFLATTQARSATYELHADDNGGHGSYWMKRYAAGVNSWGIVGDHTPRSDYIWFNSFPWASGTYHVWLGAVTEPDGNSRCRLFIGGTQVMEIRYPFSTGSLDGSSSYLKVQDLDFGEHQITNGDEIKLWGESVYPCGPDHGQYTRWYKLKFVSAGGAVDPTVITAPVGGTTLVMGQSYTLAGTGEGTLTWSYDANSDGLGETTIGTGSSVSFPIPTGITGAMTITISLDGDGGKVSETYDVREPGGGNNPPSVNLTASPNSGAAPLAVNFDSGSSDPDGDALTNKWDWDYDGSSFTVDGDTGASETASHTYDNAGTYTAAVRVSDGTDTVIDTVTITVTGSGSVTIVIECEDMNLADYFVQDDYISVDYASGKTTGTATASFPGETGRYRMEVVIVKENDGQPTVEVYVGGAPVSTIDYPLGAASRDPETVDLGEVDITSGAEIKLVGTMNDPDAAARVDKIIFTPVGGVSITVLSPNGGEIWYVGTTPHIKWTATDVDNVEIFYSTDGGVGWGLVAPSVRIWDSSWGDYPWTVPDQVSDQCLIVVQVYAGGGDFMDTSDGTFEIRAVTDIDGDGMDDGWEVDTFGDTTRADATTDYDGDRLTDYQEFMQGTDPLVPDGDDEGGTGFGCGTAGAALAVLALALLFLRLRRERPGREASRGDA